MSYPRYFLLSCIATAYAAISPVLDVWDNPTTGLNNHENQQSIGNVQNPVGDSTIVQSKGIYRCPIKSDRGVFYTVEFSVGTPPQPFRALFDTSWIELWVPSIDCAPERECNKHTRYNNSASSTYSSTSRFKLLEYSTFSTFGYLNHETVRLAGLEIKSQMFQEANGMDPIILYGSWANFDSVIGLARWSNDATRDVPSPFETAINQGFIDSRVFSIKLPQSDQEEGELVLGGIDSYHYTGDLIHLPTVPVSKPGQPWKFGEYTIGSWTVETRSVKYGDGSLIGQQYDDHVAAIESAYPFIAIPRQLKLNITEAVGAKYDYGSLTMTIPCERRALLFNITIDLGGHEFVLTPYDYAIEVTLPDRGQGCWLMLSDYGSWMSDKPAIILGAPFLRAYYSVFDMEKSQVSFGRSSNKG